MKSLKNIVFLITITSGLLLGMVRSTNAQGDIGDLKSRVEAALNPYSMHKLYVSVDEKGKVSISGEVDALYDRLDIYEIVSKIPGITEIKDLVVVNTPTLPDDIVNANIVRAIRDNSIIMEPDKITVTVSNGLVLLSGTVSYFKEKLMATTVSSSQDGVKGVENEITVMSSRKARSDENIKSILNEIVENQFPLINGTVKISVKNGDVVLDGEVKNIWEKNNLKIECLQVMGVKSVVENLKIKL
jgi:osmotically-inducible protein OsmY